MLKLASDYTTAADLWFFLTYLYVGLATVWTLVFWVSTEWLQKKNPGRWKRPRNRRITPGDWRTFNGLKWGGIILVLAGALFVASIARWMQVQEWERKFQEATKKQEEALRQELQQLKGKLYPANDPMPNHRCGPIEPNDLVIFIGSNTFIAHKFPQTILEIKGKKILAVDKGVDGSVVVSLDVLSRDGRIIARLRDGEFIINPQNYLDAIPRKDRSSLTVTDQNGTQVLDMRYINSQAIKINTVLAYPDMEPLKFNEGGTTWGGLSIKNMCARNVGAALIGLDY